MEKFLSEVRFAWRMLLKRPGFNLLAILVLALGIGANTAIFSVINGVLLRPLPYPDSERLVQVWNKYPLMDLPRASVSIPDYLDRTDQVTSFEETALFNFLSFNLSGEDTPERVVGMRATASLFSLLQTYPMIGSAFTEAEDRPGSDNVVVLSHGLWQRRFGGDRSVIGQDIRLNEEPHRIVGVMPSTFQFPTPDVQLWRPIAFTDDQKSDDSRGNEFSRMMARLKPGATIDRAQQEIDAIHRANLERFPQARTFWENSGFGGMVVDYRDEIFGDLKPVLFLLQLMVGFVLLIACGNVANLLLTRVNTRRMELSVRSALGANRWQLARQLLVESLLLSLLGGVLAVAIGVAGVRLLIWLGLDQATRGLSVGLDLQVMLFTLGLSLVTGLIFGLFPVLTIWKTHPSDAINEVARGYSGGRSGAYQRGFLVVVEVALAIVLLVGAGLLGRSFLRLIQEDPGFDPERVLVGQVSLPAAKYDDNSKIVAFQNEALLALRSLSGVENASMVSSAPFSGNSSSGSYGIEGYTPGDGESAPHALIRQVDSEYFATMGIPLRKGRFFNSSDHPDADRTVIVDQTLVDKYWPDEEPIGKRLFRGGDSNRMFFTVVGVVAPIKVQTLERPITKETIYLPVTQSPIRGITFVVKSRTPAEQLSNPMRRALLSVDPELPAYNVITLQEQVLDTLRTRRVSIWLLFVFAGMALLLASIGLYGVLAYSVSQRTRELGTRIALGANSRQILALVLRYGVVLTSIGASLGVVASLALGYSLSSMLFGVSAWDPVTLVVVCSILATVSLTACYIPARRATRVDPIDALRYQ